MTASDMPANARELCDIVRPYCPAAQGAELSFEIDPPLELDVVLRVLHTGVRAVLTGRRWWGSTGTKPRVVELNPAAPIPAGIELLAVEGDDCWDRIRPDAHIDLPKLFAAPVAKVLSHGNRRTQTPATT